jgi:hypothetical protein
VGGDWHSATSHAMRCCIVHIFTVLINGDSTATKKILTDVQPRVQGSGIVQLVLCRAS